MAVGSLFTCSVALFKEILYFVGTFLCGVGGCFLGLVGGVGCGILGLVIGVGGSFLHTLDGIGGGRAYAVGSGRSGVFCLVQFIAGNILYLAQSGVHGVESTAQCRSLFFYDRFDLVEIFLGFVDFTFVNEFLCIVFGLRTP